MEIRTGSRLLFARLESGTDVELENLTKDHLHRILPGITAAVFTVPEERPGLEADLPRVLHTMATAQECFAFLVPRRRAPMTAFREDPPFYSFACSGSFLRKLCQEITSLDFFDPYHAFCSNTFQRSSASIYAIQVPQAAPVVPVSLGKYSWIIPHRGELGLLASCLSRVKLAAGNAGRDSIMLAVDEKVTPDLLALLRTRTGIEAFQGAQPGVGPYVLRNLLIQRATSEWAVFQDSDDIPCTDRIEKLAGGFDAPDVGMVGSQEIRVDELSESVFPVRYPLDVSRALEHGPNHSLLHPTSAVRIADFLRAGSFASTGMHSMDSQFLLRSHFFFRSRNVDEFLYIRRWRAGSLCTAPATALGTLDRSLLMTSWGRGFVQVLGGALVKNTSLAQSYRSPPIHLLSIS